MSEEFGSSGALESETPAEAKTQTTEPSNDWVLAQAREAGIDVSSFTVPPCRLSGGNINFVWRVKASPHSVIVKYAPPFIAVNPAVALDPSRLNFEARALRALSPKGLLSSIADDHVAVPALLAHDEVANALVMEDLGDTIKSLKEWLSDSTATPEQARDKGYWLGRFIAKLHDKSQCLEPADFSNMPVQTVRHAVQYCGVPSMLATAGLDDATIEPLAAKCRTLGEKFATPGSGVCLIMGDLWLESVQLVPDGSLRLIDWEFCHWGSPAQDIAHLAAHLWMAQHAPTVPDATAHRASECWTGFTTGYAAVMHDSSTLARLITPQVLEDCATHTGAEILVRTVGQFQNGYLFQGLPPSDAIIRSAVQDAVAMIRSPTATTIFDVLKTA